MPWRFQSASQRIQDQEDFERETRSDTKISSQNLITLNLPVQDFLAIFVSPAQGRHSKNSGVATSVGGKAISPKIAVPLITQPVCTKNFVY